MKKKMYDYEKYGIWCNDIHGPYFGNGEMGINDNCNNEGGWIYNNGSDSSIYTCNNILKSSLFVGTAGPDDKNLFIVSDYEVFTYNY